MRSLLAMAVLAACALGAQADDARPLREQPFAGIAVRDSAEGAVIARVQPGPFGGGGGVGGGDASPRRADLLVSANDQAVDAAGFRKLVAALPVGERLTLVVRRGARSDTAAAVPRGDPEGDLLTFGAAVGSREEWTGTIGRGGPAHAQVREPQRGEFEERLREIALAEGLWADEPDGVRLDGFAAYLRRVQAQARDGFPCREVVEAFRRPLSVDRVEARIAEAVRQLAANPEQEHVDRFVRAMLQDDGTPPDLEDVRPGVPAGAFALVRRLRDTVWLDGERSAEMIGVIREARTTMWRNMFAPATRLSACDAEETLAPRAAQGVAAQLPPELAGAVTGEILFAAQLDDGRFEVVGGDGDNTYRMDVVSVVYDLGGDDVYTFAPGPDEASPSPGGHIIIDLAGNDRYESTADFCGPGVAVGGNSFIDDRAGDDVYTASGQFGMAAGLFGVGVILDRGGNDRYENLGPRSGWSQGVGFYGAGLLIDLDGDDVYHGEKLCQGVGGPRGFGAIIDAAGNDAFTANGPSFKSVYGTPGVFVAMSQGFGLGVRGYASGGVGAIYDLGGDDRYDAGEFSQGCGYFYALGLIHDASGDDLYHGNRYSQAAAAHQAVGFLIDGAGNDRYIGKTAASQSGAWDQSITMLIDRAGDDTYTADGLCQGAAAQQALAVLIDLGGSDVYAAAGGPDASVQGRSGANEYHFDLDRVFSFSILLDAGEGKDTFSTGRTGRAATGQRDPDAPARSSLYGVFADE